MQNNPNNNYNQQQNFYQNGYQYYQPPMFNMPNPEELQRMAYYKSKRKKEINSLILTGIAIGITIIVQLLMQMLSAGAMAALGLYDVYMSSSLFQNCFNVIGVHILSLAIPFGIMALILKKNFNGAPVVPTEKTGFLKGTMWVGFGLLCCVGANYITNLVILIAKELGYELSQNELAKPDSIIACAALVVSTAIIPGIIEEFALRCCTLGVLKKYGKGFAVFAVSIVFGLIHGNIIQFIFAFLVGLILGYITIRTNNIIPAMIVHGLNNGVSVVNDIVTYAANEDVAENVAVGVYIGFMVLGVIGLIYLLVKKELLPKRTAPQPKEPYAVSFGTKLLCLVPGFFIPFIILIYMTSQTITKI